MGPARDTRLELQALKDLQGVLKANLLIVLNTAKSEGKATEQGIAIADGKPIIAVGERGVVTSNIFHYLMNYRWVKTIEDAVELAKAWDPVLGWTK